MSELYNMFEITLLSFGWFVAGVGLGYLKSLYDKQIKEQKEQ